MKKIILFWIALTSIVLAGTPTPINFDQSTGNVVNAPANPINFPTGKLTINGIAPAPATGSPNYDPINAASTAQAFAIQRANHTGTQLLSTISDVTTVGANIAKMANPSALTFLRINADNSVTLRSQAQFLSDLGLATVATSGSYTDLSNKPTFLAPNVALTSQSLPDANTTLTVTGNTIILPSANWSTPRTFTLPAASSVSAGCPIDLVDTGGFMTNTANGANPMTYILAAAGSDTINGATTFTLPTIQYSWVRLYSNGSNKWIVATPTNFNFGRNNNLFFSSYRPVFHSPTDVTVGLGYDSGNNLYIIGSNSYISPSGYFTGRFTCGSGFANYFSGGIAGNALTFNLGGNNTGGFNFFSSDNTQSWLTGGFRRLSFADPVTNSKNTLGYFGDIVTSGATTSIGVGKTPSVVGLDVAGAVQTDTGFTQTGTGTNTLAGPLQLGGGTTLKAFYSATASISGTLAALSDTTFTLTLTGASATGNGSVTLGWSAALPAGVAVKQAYVSAANTVTVILYSANASPTTLSATTVRATDMEF